MKKNNESGIKNMAMIGRICDCIKICCVEF